MVKLMERKLDKKEEEEEANLQIASSKFGIIFNFIQKNLFLSINSIKFYFFNMVLLST